VVPRRLSYGRCGKVGGSLFHVRLRFPVYVPRQQEELLEYRELRLCKLFTRNDPPVLGLGAAALMTSQFAPFSSLGTFSLSARIGLRNGYPWDLG